MPATLCLTVDNLGAALDIDRGRAVRPDPDEPGLAIGLPRALALFHRLGVTATFFLEGWNGLHHPDAVRRILDHGHEVGLHGWVHERWAELPDDRQEVLLWDGTAALRSAGANPGGFRAPGGYRGRRTAAVLADLGYRYDSSIERATEERPLAVHTLPEGLGVVPWRWEHNDYWQYFMNPSGGRTARQIERSWRADLKAQAASRDGLLTLTVHPFVSFVDDEREAVVRRLIEYALAQSNVRVCSAGQLVGEVPR
ncbi:MULTISPECIES: polysaccharide deacetylase family protein [Streptomyces]|uniref:Polysaccharide deacetylase family protein n=1 Tax=Streptomyces sp. 900129855 TaxID=3155129 RepID=A0ABV2ZV44_9ACTN|nr:polysaccharide deacetylase family protein [Streptomyces sp. LUP47B]